jgi:hypothetical protein
MGKTTFWVILTQTSLRGVFKWIFAPKGKFFTYGKIGA